jgi:hypothetical protein
MNALFYLLGTVLCAQTPNAHPLQSGSAAPVPSLMPAASAPAPVGVARGNWDASAVPATAQPVGGLIAPEDLEDPASFAPNFAPPPAGYVAPPATFSGEAGGLFESDHAFDGFTTPLSNPIQSKDPRSLTEFYGSCSWPISRGRVRR